MTPHIPQLDGVIDRRFTIIKEGALVMMLNAKLNDTAQKILWEDEVQKRKRVRNSMATTGSTKTTFEISMEKNRRSLVHYRSLDISSTSLNKINLISI